MWVDVEMDGSVDDAVLGITTNDTASPLAMPLNAMMWTRTAAAIAHGTAGKGGQGHKSQPDAAFWWLVCVCSQ